MALAFDYFGRTAGVEKRPNDWDYMPLVQQLTMEQVQTDVSASVAHLSSMGADPIFTVGFCYGGSGSWAAAASGHGLAGAVGFYGRPGRMIDLVPKLDAPILALQGGADQGIPHEDNVAFEEALHEAARTTSSSSSKARRTASSTASRRSSRRRPTRPGSARSTSSAALLAVAARRLHRAGRGTSAKPPLFLILPSNAAPAFFSGGDSHCPALPRR